MSGQSDVDLVRDATDLVRLIGDHVVLRPKGREHVGLCPFHDDKNPSFAVVTHKGNAFYKCHSCGAGGDAFDFVKEYHKMEFGEALRYLADRAGITLRPRHVERSADAIGSTRSDLRKANAFASAFFRRTLGDPVAGEAARGVIQQRGISVEMVEAFQIGAAPDQWDGLSTLIERRQLPVDSFAAAGLLKDRKEGAGRYDAFRNRLIFPICDELGNPIAFGARKINPEDEPKYLNSSESPIFNKSRTLYGLHRAKRAIIEQKVAIITEGYTDVIACHQAGICNAVATLGTALTRDHARVLTKLCDTVILLFDGDEAGQKAADRGLEVFFGESIDLKVCVLPDGLDPDELLKQPGGRERFMEAIHDSIDALQYKVNRFESQLATASGLSGRQKRLEQFLAELTDLGFSTLHGVRKSLVVSRLAELLRVSTATIEASIPKTRRAADRATAAESTVESKSTDGRPSPTDASESHVTLGRQRAEKDLLGMLIYQPECMGLPVKTRSGSLQMLQDVIHPSHFVGPLSGPIAGEIFALIDQKPAFAVQDLLSRLSDSQLRNLASALYFEGERLCSNQSISAGEMLQSAFDGLMSTISHQHYESTVLSYHQAKSDPELASEKARAVIEQRRRQSNVVAAIGRGIRS